MEFIIRRISDGRFIVSVDMTVFEQEYAHVFKNKKLAFIYMQDSDLPSDEYEIIEYENGLQSEISRKELIDRFRR